MFITRVKQTFQSLKMELKRLLKTYLNFKPFQRSLFFILKYLKNTELRVVYSIKLYLMKILFNV